ncbi:MAG: DUF188 domain-containing protein [Bacillota bacterium]
MIIDADACPSNCLRIVLKHAVAHHYEVVAIASFDHQISRDNRSIVGDEPQAANIAVINQVKPGDIVVTQDWDLAVMVLSKKAGVIVPDGRIFLPEQMDSLLVARDILAKFRKRGGRIKGPARRTDDDDEKFEANFLKMLEDHFAG